MKDLEAATVEFAKKQAAKATAAWNDTVTGVLSAAKAIHAVREKIAGKGFGTFSGWAEEELKRSQETASQLAKIGERHAEFINALINLPPSWGTLYELAKESDPVFKRALRQVRPEMTRAEVAGLVADAKSELELDEPKQRPVPPKMVKRKAVESVAVERPVLPTPTRSVSATPKDAAKRLTVNWKAAHAELKTIVRETVRDKQSLSDEAKKFLLSQYVQPMQQLLEEIVTCLA